MSRREQPGPEQDVNLDESLPPIPLADAPVPDAVHSTPPTVLPGDSPPRLFRDQPDWRILVHQDDSKLHCHRMLANQDYYHRIAASELYCQRDLTVYCIPCALTVGILSTVPPILRQSVQG